MIACVLIPHFAAAVERREDPSLVRVPLVIGGPGGEPGEVHAVSGEAAQMGVRPGMLLSQAQALCPQARTIAAAPRRYERAFEELMEVLAGFASLVEASDRRPSAICYLNLGNPGGTGGLAMVQDIGRAVRQRVGLAPALGLAGGKFPARVAASAVEPNKALRIAPGNEVAFLAPFPVGLLPLDEDTARRLQLLGIRTLGQLAALPAGAVLAQFGRAGQHLRRLAGGRDDRPVLPHRRQASESVSRPLNGPAADRLALEAVVGTVAEELAARLQDSGRMGRELGVILHLEDGTTRQGELVLRQPTSGAEHLARTLIEILARIQVTCGVVELEVTLAGLVPATGQQLDLFVPRTGQESRLRQTLSDLTARYGADCFYRVSLAEREAYLPERRFQLLKADGP